MCTEETIHAEAEARRAAGLSRRRFNLSLLSAAAIAALPGSAFPKSARGHRVEVKTKDGLADGYFACPRKGKHPAIVMWPDFMGLRPTYMRLADKLAQSGYAVLAPNLYYRHAVAPIVEKANFDDQIAMGKLRQYAGALTPETIRGDAEAYLAFLERHPSVDVERKFGVFGYCMGGGHAFKTAEVGSERVGAVASFHGDLVSERPSSAHLSIPKIKAKALIAIAAGDHERDPEEQAKLRDAFASIGASAEIEVYAGTQHGWCTPDMVSLYHAAQAKRAWERLLALFQRAL